MSAIHKMVRRLPRKTGRRLTKRQSTQVKRLINSNCEKKFTDNAITLGTTTNAVGISALINIAQGLTDTDRVGDTIELKKVEFNYIVGQPIPTAAGIKDNHSCRVMIIQWKGETVPSNVQIFQTVTTSAVSVSQYNKDSLRKLMRVLYDRTFYVSDSGPQIVGEMNKVLRRFSKEVTFRAGGGLPIDNQLYFINVSDFAAAVGEVAPVYNFRSRVTFTDS